MAASSCNQWAFAAWLALSTACSASRDGAQDDAATASAVKVEDLSLGAGATATSGKRVSIHYRGWLANGSALDSSRLRGQPLGFRLGRGEVIAGWDQGVSGMKVGGKRRLTIPPVLAYGALGNPGGPIPPDATLVYEVELLRAD